MTSKFLIALALAVALVTGSAAVAPKAEAGMRVGFGFPLGILVAKSMMSQKNSGHSGNETYRKRYYSAKKNYKEKSYTAERKDTSSARRSSVASTQRSKDKSDKVTPATTTAAVKETDKDEVENETAAADPVEETTENGTDCKQFFPNIGKTLTVPCNDKTASKKKDEAKETTTVKADSTSSKTSGKTASAQTKSSDCKKFFPNVGMTVSVPCSE